MIGVRAGINRVTVDSNEVSAASNFLVVFVGKLQLYAQLSNQVVIVSCGARGFGNAESANLDEIVASLL